MSERSTIKCRRCPAQIRRDGNVTGLCAECFRKEQAASTGSAMVQADRDRARLSDENSLLKKKYAAVLADVKRLERSLKAMNVLSSGVETYEIPEHHGSGTSEGTVFAVASDWHSEERVRPGEVSGLNEFNLDIARERAGRFWAGTVRLTRLIEQDLHVPQIVVPLLGDFISNDIHEEIAEVALLEPMHAITFARNLIISGIDFTLNHTKQKLHFVCHSGNHGRTTKTTRAATENGHSLEYLMYLHLADYYRSEERVSFSIPEGYHSYMDVYGDVIRFHHGHEVRFQGGVGGFTIPANKAIAKWDEARQAKLDVFGHFHQAFDGKKFICNGSLIGFNAYALRNKFGYEPPVQQLFVMDKKRGKTCVWPILVGANRTR